jgi:hypothetical protein
VSPKARKDAMPGAHEDRDRSLRRFESVEQLECPLGIVDHIGTGRRGKDGAQRGIGGDMLQLPGPESVVDRHDYRADHRGSENRLDELDAVGHEQPHP